MGVRIFTIDGTRELETEGEPTRTSDLLNHTDHRLRIRESGAGGWEFVDVDELLVVVPPGPEQRPDLATPSASPARARQARAIYRGRGSDIQAGSQATSFLVPQRHHFVALTEATIQHRASPGDYRVAVAIVNLRMAESLQEGGANAGRVASGPTRRRTADLKRLRQER